MYRGSYIRTADGDHLMQRYEIDRLLEQSHQPSWDLEIVHRASLDDLDDELTNRIIAREKEIHPRIFGKASTLQAMHRLNIIATDADGTVRQPWLACLLLEPTHSNFSRSYRLPSPIIVAQLKPATHPESATRIR